MSQPSAHPVREEELKNRVATVYFGKYDCTRIVGNIDFCVCAKRRDVWQMTLLPDAPIFWAEAKNHQTDIYRMLAQLILTIKGGFASHFMSDFINGRAASPLVAAAVARDARPYQDELDLSGTKGGKDGWMPGEPSLSTRAAGGQNRSAGIHLPAVSLSPAARSVLSAGRELWRYYHAQPNANPNASYYDIRLHFQGVKKTASGKEQMNATSSDATYNARLAALRSAHRILAAQIEPKVYEYGFLKR